MLFLPQVVSQLLKAIRISGMLETVSKVVCNRAYRDRMRFDAKGSKCISRSSRRKGV